MDTPINQLFEQFNHYLTRLRADLAQIAQSMPPEKRDAFQVPEYSFEAFCQRWKTISLDSALLERWQKRLSPSGYDDELMTIRAAIATALGPPGNTQNAAA